MLKCPPDDLATSKRVVKRALKYMSASFDAGGGKVERSCMDACEAASVSRSSLRLPDSEASGRQQEGIQAILEQDDANCDANVDPNSPVTSYYQQLKSGAVVPQGNELPDLDTLTGVPFGVTRLGGEEPEEPNKPVELWSWSPVDQLSRSFCHLQRIGNTILERRVSQED